jgi:hypothetical protein
MTPTDVLMAIQDDMNEGIDETNGILLAILEVLKRIEEKLP